MSITTHYFGVTLFDDAAAKVAHGEIVNLPQLRDLIAGASAPTKAQLRWLKLARFGRRRTSTGCLRHNDNMVAATGVELDYDAGSVSMAQAKTRLRKLGIRALLYTSPSHTVARPKWRVLAPFSRELPARDRQRYAKRIESVLEIAFDPASFVLSQAFYFGAALDNPAARHQAVVVDGECVDLLDHLAAHDEPEPPPPNAEMVAAMERDAGRGISDAPEDNAGFATMSEDDLEQELRAALMVIPADDYHDWIKVGAAIREGLGDAGADLFHEWSGTSSKYDRKECERKWEKHIPAMRRVTVSSIFWLADQNDPGWRDLYRQARATGVRL